MDISVCGNKVNLCESCQKQYPECSGGVFFGDGIGMDNVCCCSEYRPLVKNKWSKDGKYKHGDLIDVNALKIKIMTEEYDSRMDFLKHVMDCINNAPAVIPSNLNAYDCEEDE